MPSITWCFFPFVGTFFHWCTTVSPGMLSVLFLFPDHLFSLSNLHSWPMFFTSNCPQACSIQLTGAFFPLLEPFSIDAQLLVLVCCLCYFYSLIFFSLSNLDSCPMFFTSNYPQVRSIQLSGAFLPLLEPFFIDAQLWVLVCCPCYFYSLIFFFSLSKLDSCAMFLLSILLLFSVVSLVGEKHLWIFMNYSE